MKRNLNPPMKRALRLKNLFLTVCFLLIGTAAFSQERTITGVVTDSSKEPLIGVSIVVQGTNTGVVTGLDGDYSIQVQPNATLDFSYVGMEKQSIKVGNQSVINVQMKEDSQMLAETVVPADLAPLSCLMITSEMDVLLFPILSSIHTLHGSLGCLIKQCSSFSLVLKVHHTSYRIRGCS